MTLISFSRDKFIPSEEVSLSIKSNFLSIVRGYQVFTFFKTINNGNPVFLDDHINRVFSNANDMKMKIKSAFSLGCRKYCDIVELVLHVLRRVKGQCFQSCREMYCSTKLTPPFFVYFWFNV